MSLAGGSVCACTAGMNAIHEVKRIAKPVFIELPPRSGFSGCGFGFRLPPTKPRWALRNDRPQRYLCRVCVKRVSGLPDESKIREWRSIRVLVGAQDIGPFVDLVLEIAGEE